MSLQRGDRHSRQLMRSTGRAVGSRLSLSWWTERKAAARTLRNVATKLCLSLRAPTSSAPMPANDRTSRLLDALSSALSQQKLEGLAKEFEASLRSSRLPLQRPARESFRSLTIHLSRRLVTS